jgi:hypothetical protein
MDHGAVRQATSIAALRKLIAAAARAIQPRVRPGVHGPGFAMLALRVEPFLNSPKTVRAAATPPFHRGR